MTARSGTPPFHRSQVRLKGLRVRPKKICIHVVDSLGSPTHAHVEMVAGDLSANQCPTTTSALMPHDAATAIAALYGSADSVPPTYQSLRTVLGMVGRTSWANTASSGRNAAKAAALAACTDIKAQDNRWDTVQGVVVVTTLTPECRFIDVIKTVLDTVATEFPPGVRLATAIVIHDGLPDHRTIQVQLLATGLQG